MNIPLRNGHQLIRRLTALLPIVFLFSSVLSPNLPARAEISGWTQTQQAVPRFESGPCNYDVPTLPEIKQNLQCGSLIVPELYENPTGPTIQLAVAIYKSSAPDPAPDPLVMLQGGPGGSTIYTYLQFLSVDARLRSLNRDIVLFDQRGTEFSKPSLFCEPYYQEGIKQLNEDISKDESNQRVQAALKACHDQFVQEGINLSAYNSLENAGDVESLRQVLGYSKINLYGVSYGTLLALHVLKQYPQGLRSVTIDSVVPPQKNYIIDAPRSENRALEEIFTTCAQQSACNAAYPNLKKVFYDEVDQLNAHKAHIQVRDQESGKTYPALLDGDSYLNIIVQMLYFTELLPLIPRTIYDVRAGDYSFISQILSLVVFDRSINFGMYFSVLCAEDADFRPQDYNLSGLPKQLANAEKDSAVQILQTCSAWNVKQLPASVDEPVSSSVPTLVLAGAFDPITPPAYAQEAARTLSRSYFFVFPAGGHGAVTSGECQDMVFIDFLNNPNQKPDGACVAQQKMVFSTPESLIRIPKLAEIIQLQGTSPVELGLYVLALLFLLSALLVYPIAWLARLIRRPTVPAGAPGELAAAPASRPWIVRLGPWFAGLAGLLLLVFFIALTVITINVVLANNSALRLDLPGSTRPLFILPWVAAFLALIMFIGAVIVWARRIGSAGGRLYYSLLTISAWVCVAVLMIWGILGVILQR